MARERMVTRTITTTKFEVLTCTVVNPEVKTEYVTVPGKFVGESADKILKAVKAVYETAVIKVVAVLNDGEEIETLYGMPESEFIRNAVILPPRAIQE